MKGSGKSRQYDRARRGSVMPYLIQVRLQRNLNDWLEKTSLAEIENSTNLSIYDVRIAVEHHLLSLSVKELEHVADVFEELGAVETVLLIHDLKEEEL